MGATLVRDVEPGELVRIDDRGLHSARFAETPRAALCIFEFVYLARPDSRLLGTSVHEARREMGRLLAGEHPAEADMVIAVPQTAHAAAQGYAEASGIAVRRRSDQEQLRRSHVHPALAIAPGPRA